MSWKRTLFFLLVVVGLAGFYFIKIQGQHSSENSFSFATEAAKTRILALDAKEKVRRMTVRDFLKDTELSFSKSDDQTWRITQPVDYPAESIIVDGLVSLLKLAPQIRPLSLSGLDPHEFGFDTPQLSICIATDLKPEGRCLIVGFDAVVTQGAYAKWNTESKYFLVDSSFLSAFDKTLYSVRKKQIFTLLEKEISLIQFKSSKREFEIKHSGKNWMLEKPEKAMLGNDAINGLFLNLSNLFVKEFLDTARVENRKLGVKPGERIIHVVFQDGSEQVLVQGKEAPGRDAYYALGEDGKTVFLVSLGKLNQIEELFRKLVS